MTPGKVRGLDQASTEAGVFSVFAIDHRDSMRVVLDPDEPESVPDAVLTDLKLEFTQALAHDASAILLDPEYSAIPAIERRAIRTPGRQPCSTGGVLPKPSGSAPPG
jgi:tagatose-1,6-bisphosphate aldolase